MLAALAVLVGAGVCVAEPNEPVGPEGMRTAVAALQSGDEAKALPILESNALAGDSRAQYLLGALYLTSKSLPSNKPLGFAWLQLAADSAGAYGGWSSREAAVFMAKAEPMMSGRELLEADRIADALGARIAAARLEQLRPALNVYSGAAGQLREGTFRFDDPEVRIVVPDAPSSEPLLHLGCADARRSGCPSHRDVGPSFCTGRIVWWDTSPSAQGGVAMITQPAYPVSARREGSSGRIDLLAHVDSSGWVCSVVLSKSSGDLPLDRAALDAVRQWRINPALAGGKPVESLWTFSVSYELH